MQQSKELKVGFDGQAVGEIFLCDSSTDGNLIVLDQFLGRAMTKLGGGCNKMYVIAKENGLEGMLVPIHSPENDM